MNDTITVRGYVATDVRSTTADSGLAIAGFRMCTTERRYDRDTGSWTDGQTNWFSVSLFRQLATNAAFSVHKGDRVIVTGRLKVRQWATDDGRSGTSVDIDAESVGHDLMWGTANYRRNVQDRTAGGAGGGEASEGTAGEDRESDDLPADLDLETGELAGTGTGGPSAAGAEDSLQDPFTLSDSALLKDALSKETPSREASSKNSASPESAAKDAIPKAEVRVGGAGLEGAGAAGAGRGRGRMGG